MDKILELKKWITDRSEQIIGWEEVEKKILEGKKIKIKYGADPTRPDLHLGHMACMRMMRKFQDEFNAEVQFLIGDFTTKVGDPTGKSKTRPMISDIQIAKNVETYSIQMEKVLDISKTSVWLPGKKNKSIKNCQGGWWSEMKVPDFFNLLTLVTHSRLIERDMFQKRIKGSEHIYMHELMYPILQGYDSVMMESDLTIIGSDQLFNEMFGRDFQSKFGQVPQGIITLQLLRGLDGHEKMSKSLDNYIGLTETADNIFGKTMSIPDDLIIEWMRLLTDMDHKKALNEMKEGHNPRDIKMSLGKELVRFFYDDNQANLAQENFVNVFSKKENPEDMQEITVELEKSVNVLDWLVDNKLVSSKSEARRLIEQGGLKINDEKMIDSKKDLDLKNDMVIKIGKRKFVKIIIK